VSGGHGSGGGRRRRHAHEEEEHENHERWLVTYADMLTLLFVLFVVLFAMSTVDKKKFEALKEGLAAGFGAPLSAMDGGQGALDQKGTQPQAVDALESVMTPTQAGVDGSSSPSTSTSGAKVTKQALDAARAQLAAQDLADRAAKAAKLSALEKKIDAEIAKKGLQDTVQTHINSKGLVINVVTHRVIFNPDSADLTPTGIRVMQTVAPILKTVDNEILISGNTDTQKVHPKGFLDDFDLAGQRAIHVEHYLVTTQGLSEDRFEIAGQGDNDPIADPAKVQNADQVNRRVDIVVLADSDRSGAVDQADASQTSADRSAISSSTASTTTTASGR